jgi:hypothetical protein
MSRWLLASLVPMLVALAGCQTECESCGPSPELALLSPDSLVVLPLGSTSIGVVFEVAELILDPGDEPVDGQGKVVLALDAVPEVATDLVFAEPTLTFELPGDLPAGPHRLLGQIIRGDDTPYDNPESTTHTVFFIEDANPARPQVAFVEPRPFIEHVLGEPLEIEIAVRNFDLVPNATDCHVAEDCDPFDLASECTVEPFCDGQSVSTTGHVKIYAEPDYPACLFDTPLDCNYEYIASIRPESGPVHQVTATIAGERFEEAGTTTLSVALSYNNHAVYPNRQFVIYDQITIELVER